MILVKRIAPLLLALIVVFAAAVPSLAAEPYTQFLPETVIDGVWDDTENIFFAEFHLSSDLYSFPGVYDGTVPVTFVVDGIPYVLYAQDLGFNDQIFFGNSSLVDPSFPSSDVDFIVVINADLLSFFTSSVDYGSLTLEIYVGDKPAEFDQGLLDDFGTVAGAVMGFVVTIADTIVSTPLLLLTVGFFFGGGCVGIFGRILSKN